MEYWDIYNSSGEKTGKKVKKGEPLLPGEYHPAMEAWIVNSSGQVLVQKRSMSCELLPGIWALTTGRMVSGESTLEGCVRELDEELGLIVRLDDVTFLRRILREDGTHLIWDVYLVRADAEISELNLQTEEVSEAKWATFDEITDMVGNGIMFKYPEIEEIIEQISGIVGQSC